MHYKYNAHLFIMSTGIVLSSVVVLHCLVKIYTKVLYVQAL